jgi:hypothetical protein
MTVKTVHEETVGPIGMFMSFPVDEPAAQMRRRETAELKTRKGEMP